MKIAYNTGHSSFWESIERALDRTGSDLGRGVRLELPSRPRGYRGDIVIVIGLDDDEFETDWSSADKTRFPARFKAAATVLRRRKLFGRFRISHDEGTLIVKQEGR